MFIYYHILFFNMYHIRYKTRAGEFVRNKTTKEEGENYYNYISQLAGIQVIGITHDGDDEETSGEYKNVLPLKHTTPSKKDTNKITWGNPPRLKKGDIRR